MNQTPDAQLRMYAIDMAIRYISHMPQPADYNIVSITKEIYEFIKGETE
jgi:hypothetical protein